jgi:SP family facilitated glucose transporter-like MFS transporter 8
MVLNQYCGIFAMINFTETIFQKSGSNLSPLVSSIIVAGIQIVGSLMPTFLVERLGRKLMMSVSAFGTCIGLSLLGGYIYLQSIGFDVEAFNFVPLLAFSFAIFLANLGILTLPFMVLSEIAPPKVNFRFSTVEHEYKL